MSLMRSLSINSELYTFDMNVSSCQSIQKIFSSKYFVLLKLQLQARKVVRIYWSLANKCQLSVESSLAIKLPDLEINLYWQFIVNKSIVETTVFNFQILTISKITSCEKVILRLYLAQKFSFRRQFVDRSFKRIKNLHTSRPPARLGGDAKTRPVWSTPWINGTRRMIYSNDDSNHSSPRLSYSV